jgi:hypothetical protein
MIMSKPAHIILFRILGFVFFLILLAAANVLIPFINKDLYTSIVMFLNSNIILLFIMTCIGMVNELFWSFNFPFNVAAPITGGVLGVYIVMFFYQIWNFINMYLNLGITIRIGSFYFLIFLFVMVLGYVVILSRNGKTREDWEERLKRRHKEMGKNKKHEGEEIEWKDVEREFRLIFYNIGRGINSLFEGNKKKGKGKR